MEMQVRTNAWGGTVKGVGVSGAQQLWILMRDSPEEGVVGLKITDWFEVAGKDTIVGFANLATNWFPVNVCANSWLFDLQDIVGYIGEGTLSGGAFLSLEQARIDTDFKVIDEFGEVENQLTARSIPVALGSVSFGTVNVEG